MTGIEKIKSKIVEDANARALQVEEQARQEARSIMDRALLTADQKRLELLKNAEHEGAEAYKSLLAVAGLEGRKEILRAKQDMVDEAFQTALDRVCQLPDQQYQKLLEDLIVNAAGNNSGEILLSDKDAKRMDTQFISNINKRLASSGKSSILTLSKENIRTVGGFTLKSGDMEMNSTFEILFSMLRPQLENEVVRHLFNT